MSEPDGGRLGGRHSQQSPTHSDDAVGGFPGGAQWPGYRAPHYEPARYDPRNFGLPPTRSYEAVDRTSGSAHRSGVLDRSVDQTGPVVEPEWWARGCSDAGKSENVASARYSGDRNGGEEPGRAEDGAGRAEEGPGRYEGESYGNESYRAAGSGTDRDGGRPAHPSAPLPPLPTGTWDKLAARSIDLDDDATIAQAAVTGGRPPADLDEVEPHGETDVHRLDPTAEASSWEDQTGGLEVIGAHVDEERPRRGRRGRRQASGASARQADGPDDEIPLEPYDHRAARGRRRRRPVAMLLSLVVLAGLVFGIVVGGQKLLEVIDPSARDYTGQGSGSVEVRVRAGDTLSDIARTLVEADVVASTGPFISAAGSNDAAMGIQPGVYQMREQMSGQAALDQLLDPVARLLSRVAIPEGLTAAATLTRLAERTGRPVEELEAAAADPAALGLPSWTNGSVEGFLFPATYEFEPDTSAAEMLRAMVNRAEQAFTQLQIPAERLQQVLTEASIVQAEAASPEDMAKVARVLENRTALGMPLQLDTTVNYANGKGGITTTAGDRANPSPYNTYVHVGLPPGPISNPGEEALAAALAPADGDWLFFVVVDPDTGETRFAETVEQHGANVEIFRQWLRENPDE